MMKPSSPLRPRFSATSWSRSVSSKAKSSSRKCLTRASIQRLLPSARREGGKATITFPSRRADGSRRWMEARVRHFRDEDFALLDTDLDQEVALNRGRSGEEGFIITLRDITRRHRAEQELESVNRKLASMAWNDGLTGLGNRRRFDQGTGRQLGKVPARGHGRCRWSWWMWTTSSATTTSTATMREITAWRWWPAPSAAACAASWIAPPATAGEEFGLVLPGISAADAGEIAERIRRGIQQLAVPHVGSPLLVLTVSIGVAACVPFEEGRPEDLVNAADRALYTSKAEGRNRMAVTTYNAPEQS